MQISNKINITLWPISERINGDETLPYNEAIDRMIEAYNMKLQWLDETISKFNTLCDRTKNPPGGWIFLLV